LSQRRVFNKIKKWSWVEYSLAVSAYTHVWGSGFEPNSGVVVGGDNDIDMTDSHFKSKFTVEKEKDGQARFLISSKTTGEMNTSPD
jgi:hypothetical protein